MLYTNAEANKIKVFIVHVNKMYEWVLTWKNKYVYELIWMKIYDREILNFIQLICKKK